MISYYTENLSGVRCLLKKEKAMVVICVDNTPILLQTLKDNAVRAFPNADVQAFPLEEQAFAYAKFI